MSPLAEKLTPLVRSILMTNRDVIVHNSRRIAFRLIYNETPVIIDCLIEAVQGLSLEDIPHFREHITEKFVAAVQSRHDLILSHAGSWINRIILKNTMDSIIEGIPVYFDYVLKPIFGEIYHVETTLC